ncbi:MAG: TrkH family potassium uptake protein [Spartobacteria bacterium]|nr:TrkH family potassium uptake protein [Spartobacteria bacterium]
MKAIIHAVALVGLLMGVSMIPCCGIALWYCDPDPILKTFLITGLVCILVSVAAWFFSRGTAKVKKHDGIILVLVSWLLCGFIGALPYLLTGTIADPFSALFESFSGLTTTGASVLTNLEQLPRAVLFWRSLTHFLGGVGILIVFVAILPFVGVGGVQLYKAESTGLTDDRLTARIADTARIILGIYIALNVLCTVLLRLGGLSWFDSVCQAFGTIATGGFSTRTDSIAAFNNPYVEWVIIVFMFLSGVSFVLHYRAFKGVYSAYHRSEEFQLFAVLCIVVSTISAFLIKNQLGMSFPIAFRTAAFQTVSLFSTTGFITADYDVWPNVIRLMFLILMVFGACAGSTSGAIKSVRIVVAWKRIRQQFQQFVRPSHVTIIKLDGKPITNELADKATTYIVIYIMLILVASLIVSLFVPDAMTAISAVIACLGGVGPGMSVAGPTETFAQFPAIAKSILIICMLLGRLEIFVCLVVFTPGFWKKW